MTRRAFSLIEALVCTAIIALLLAILLPTLRGAREAGRAAACLSNTRQLVTAWTAYANDFRDRAMPLAYWSEADIGSGNPVYWWGAVGGPLQEVRYERGFIAPYMGAELARNSVFECPSQPWGSYRPQGGFAQPTSTYGYNGYYLCPSRTPGWADQISRRPWRRLFEIQRPADLFVFADALLPTTQPRNTALLDPPLLFDGAGWTRNDYPTTAFRHARGPSKPGSSNTARADGSVVGVRAIPQWIRVTTHAVGSVGETNDPHYVPDAAEWR
ncbi:MAG: DUF1559 domain-containing protein [Planctomycetota bacterium]|nr:DUF1559 domain-containing protein [Planctomycetota bacterium]